MDPASLDGTCSRRVDEPPPVGENGLAGERGAGARAVAEGMPMSESETRMVVDPDARCAAPLPTWPHDATAICERIVRNRATLKILLKTRDELVFLRRWIEHHASVCGLENLVIADNMSQDPAVLRVYEAYGDKATIFKFDAPHNRFHDRTVFGDLYRAVAASADYAIFLDTDERLVLVDGDAWSTDGVCDLLEGRRPRHALAGTWLDNLPGSETEFLCDRRGRRLASGLSWGKPILPVWMLGRPVIHNSQYAEADFGQRPLRGLFVLHLRNLSREQRLASNKRKLVSRRLVREDTPLQAIRHLRFPQDAPAQGYVEEIERLLDAPRPDASAREFDVVSFLPDGRLAFSRDSVRQAFVRWLASSPAEDACAAGGGDGERASGGVRAVSEAGDAPDGSPGGRQSANERRLRRGMAEEPERVDGFGDPAFRKELMRLLLSEGRWAEAEALVPEPGGPGQEGWHHILFARALDAAGRSTEARGHWQAFAAAHPDHPEARKALRNGT